MKGAQCPGQGPLGTSHSDADLAAASPAVCLVLVPSINSGVSLGSARGPCSPAVLWMRFSAGQTSGRDHGHAFLFCRCMCSLNTFSEVTWGPSPGLPLRQGRTGGTSSKQVFFFWMKGVSSLPPWRSLGWGPPWQTGQLARGSRSSLKCSRCLDVLLKWVSHVGQGRKISPGTTSWDLQNQDSPELEIRSCRCLGS